MSIQRVVVVAGPGAPTNILLNRLRVRADLMGVVMEGAQDKWLLMRRRAGRIGWWKMLGQLLFVYGIVPWLRRGGAARYARVLEQHRLNDVEPTGLAFHRVASINSDEAIDAVRKLRPTIVVVSGTRIISAKVLSAVGVPFLNVHAGITPRYRGIHGLYWALYNDDAENAGVTVHRVDSGIDTGMIVAQAQVAHTDQDNFTTYPALQLAKGLELLEAALDQAARGTLPSITSAMDSHLWHHPTWLQYLRARWTKGVK